ncbi:MAG: hypothetical protein WCP08_03760 [Prolixibacteraceae bacterium]
MPDSGFGRFSHSKIIHRQGLVVNTGRVDDEHTRESYILRVNTYLPNNFCRKRGNVKIGYLLETILPCTCLKA